MNTLTRYSFVPIACSILLFIQRHFQFSPEMDTNRFPTLFHVKKSSVNVMTTHVKLNLRRINFVEQ